MDGQAASPPLLFFFCFPNLYHVACSLIRSWRPFVYNKKTMLARRRWCKTLKGLFPEKVYFLSSFSCLVAASKNWRANSALNSSSDVRKEGREGGRERGILRIVEKRVLLTHAWTPFLYSTGWPGALESGCLRTTCNDWSQETADFAPNQTLSPPLMSCWPSSLCFPLSPIAPAAPAQSAILIQLIWVQSLSDSVAGTAFGFELFSWNLTIQLNTFQLQWGQF